MSLVPLMVTTTYSLLQSTITPQKLAQTAKERGYQAVGIADKNVLYAAVDFYHAANTAGIHPLIGMHAQLTMGTSEYSLLLYARNLDGYRQLMRLSTKLMTAEQQDSLDFAALKDLSSELDGIVLPDTALLVTEPRVVSSDLGQLQTLLNNRFYLGIHLSLSPAERKVVQQLSVQLNIPLVATPNVNYLNRDDYFANQVLQSIGRGQKISDPLQVSQIQGRDYLPQEHALEQHYLAAGLQKAVANTQKIADECRLELQFQSPVLPEFPIPRGQNRRQYLYDLCIEGLRKRQPAPGVKIIDYQKRLEYELGIIHQMGFDDYFLIVWDVMHFIHRTGITTGPGRGSAAGSLVAYALAITDVDPLQYHLLFERFLNPERAQMPDIDLDIPDNRRQEVLQYVHQRYGHDHVAQIITFGTLAARQVVRDVGRVFGLPDYRLEQVADILRSFGPGKYQLVDVLKQSQPLQNLMADDPLNLLLIQVAEKLEGLPRHYSTHAAGVVLSAKPLLDMVPLQRGNDPAGLLMTQFEKGTVEALGLLKMDFLGLRNLSIMDDALKLVHQTHPDFDITKISLADQSTLALFQQEKTDGIFQFESAGIRRTLKELKPTNFEDIVAVNALYRPGPMENIPTFLARRHGQERVQLPDQSLAPILGPTYGILVYQEQVMQVASVMAGFTMGQADLLRRAMSKKKQEAMASMRQRFLKGALANGYSQAVAEQVFAYIDRFANYGFNRSHAVAYSKMAFEMAYLKAHFTAAFYTALLSIEPNFDKEQQHFAAASELGVKILPPSINESQAAFTLVNGKIITGFTMIKGMRRDFMSAIVDARKDGPYRSLADFINRIDPQFQKAKLIAPLIYVGAFDGLGYNRAEMIAGLDGLLESSEFSFQSADLQPVMEQRNEYPLSFRLAKEREYLGIYLSGHPVSQYAALRSQLHALKVSQLRPKERVTIILMINRIRRINTKRTHEPMAFVTASDESGTVEITIFPQYLRQFDQLLKTQAILVFTANTELRNGKLQLLAGSCVAVDQVIQQNAVHRQRWVIRLANQAGLTKGQEFLRQVAKNQAGDIPVVLFDVESQRAIRLSEKYNLQANTLVQRKLSHYFGNDNVVLQTL